MHLAHIGHPLLGDMTYGAGFKASARKLGQEAQAALAALGRQALHAAELAFVHPVTGKRLRFASPLPADMARLAAALERIGPAAAQALLYHLPAEFAPAQRATKVHGQAQSVSRAAGTDPGAGLAEPAVGDGERARPSTGCAMLAVSALALWPSTGRDQRAELELERAAGPTASSSQSDGRISQRRALTSLLQLFSYELFR